MSNPQSTENPKRTENVEYVSDCNISYRGDYLCIDLTFEGACGHQGTGTYALIGFKKELNTTKIWFEKLRQIFDLPDEVPFLHLIKGKLCRVIRDDGYFISGIGHPVYKYIVFNFKEDLTK